MCSLCNLLPGQKCKISTLGGSDITSRRLQELGFVKNAEVECLFKSFCGDPVAYKIKGSIIALRNIDAKNITVVLTEDFNE